MSDIASDQIVWSTVPSACRDAASRWGGGRAIVDGALTLSYEELWQEACRASSAFVASGVGPGDRVAIWAPNIAEWIIAAVGAHRAGAIIVPLNTRFKGEEAAYVIQHSGAKILLTVTGFLGLDYVGEVRGSSLAAGHLETSVLEDIVVLRGEAVEGTTSWADFTARGNATSRAAADAAFDALKPEDVSDLMFTSGTTGKPKAAMLTHGQATRAFTDWSGEVGLNEGDRYLIVNPFFHSFGYKAGWLAALLRGATIVPCAAFDPQVVLELIERERVSFLPGPPALFQSILDFPERSRFDYSSLRVTVTGAANVPPELIERLSTDLGFDSVVTGYGLTEACGVLTTCRTGDPLDLVARSCGRAIPGVELRVVDECGVDVPDGTEGELLARGYNVMVGYFEDDAATAETIDSAGWLKTGDIVVRSQGGYIRVTDRKKDMFIVGGFNVYPAEVEQALLQYPGISQVAVVGVPDARMGEVGVAFVKCIQGQSVDPAELLAWTRTRLANFKVPRRVEIVEEFPMNASGKILKFKLRESLAQESTTTN